MTTHDLYLDGTHGSHLTTASHRRSRRRIVPAITIGVATLLLSACGTAPSIVGVWQPDDGTGVKTIRADGTCTGMYYNQGAPLDIGGTTTCQLSSTSDDDGTYTLVVEQPPNRASYDVAFEGNDQMSVQFGNFTVTMARQ